MAPVTPYLYCELYEEEDLCQVFDYEPALWQIILQGSWDFKIKQSFTEEEAGRAGLTGLTHIRFCNDFDEPAEAKKDAIMKLVRAAQENGEESIAKFFSRFVDCDTIKLGDSMPSAETLPDGDDGSSTMSSQNWMLPCKAFDGIWEDLYFKDDTKAELLRFSQTCLKLGESGVNPNIILCNRLILLHGPPGTGKTTICRALAQKLSVRKNSLYFNTQLVEINCHSLFSKWFSESGKLVSKMFSTIRQYAEDPEMLVVVLIDEVESLTAARQAAMNSNEPSDAIRVVNAVLNQLDNLRFLGNVLTLATSNLTGAIDNAFTDRADLIKYVGLPGSQERALILESCFRELEKSRILLPPSSKADGEGSIDTIIQATEGLSGRTLRKLPVIALAELPFAARIQIPHITFMKAMTKAASRLKKDRSLITSS